MALLVQQQILDINVTVQSYIQELIARHVSTVMFVINEGVYFIINTPMLDCPSYWTFHFSHFLILT
jgi:hypothetical protein